MVIAPNLGSSFLGTDVTGEGTCGRRRGGVMGRPGEKRRKSGYFHISEMGYPSGHTERAGSTQLLHRIWP